MTHSIYNYICSDIYFYNILGYSGLGTSINTKMYVCICKHHPVGVVWDCNYSCNTTQTRVILLSNGSLMIC